MMISSILLLILQVVLFLWYKRFGSKNKTDFQKDLIFILYIIFIVLIVIAIKI